MELELLITELDQTTIQLDKINFLATKIMSKASEKAKHAKNALEYDFESQEIVKCSSILLDYVEMADTAIKRRFTSWPFMIRNSKRCSESIES